MRHGNIDMADLGRRLLLLLGNLLDETCSARARGTPDLAALLAESRSRRHQVVWHHKLGREQGRHQACVLTQRPLAAPNAYASPHGNLPQVV